MRRQVLAEEESFFELGDEANFVAFGQGDEANWNDDDDDDVFDARADDDEWEDDDGIRELEMRYREGQAAGRCRRPRRGARFGFESQIRLALGRQPDGLFDTATSGQSRRRRPGHGGVPPRGVRRPGRTLRR